MTLTSSRPVAATGSSAGSPTGINSRRRRGPRTRTVITGVVLAVIAAIWIYPFVWLVSASFKTTSEVFGRGLSLIPEQWRWENYARAWTDVGFAHYMINTVIITLGTVLLVIIRCALAGYVLGRKTFPGKRPLIVLFLITFFIPEGYTIIPITQLTDQLHLLNTHLGVILGLGAGGQVTAILLYAGYFAKLPKELEECAELDGAGPIRIFAQIMLPLAWPITSTVFILTFLFAWNVYLLPLVFTLSDPDLRTLAVGMTVFVSEQSTDWSGMAAAAVISLAPVIAVFAVLQRRFVDSIAGAVKQ
ncbi:MAG TPA: carbohydrate ABC transporter permease [Microlunatus sp.]